MIKASGARGSFFDDRAIEPFGAKLVGNFQFAVPSGQGSADAYGYVSPGHNSAHFDDKTGKAFVVFHTRFPGTREMHQVRVHQLLFNEDGWPLIAPHRYAGETLGSYSPEQVTGEYELINHGRQISRDITRSQTIRLAPDGAITGQQTGTWRKTGQSTLTLTVDGKEYKGVLLRQWDNTRGAPVMTFTALSSEGVALWGSALPGEGQTR
jgi:arabinan endo-1,5-alpha-L-arabinosidase